MSQQRSTPGPGWMSELIQPSGITRPQAQWRRSFLPVILRFPWPSPGAGRRPRLRNRKRSVCAKLAQSGLPSASRRGGRYHLWRSSSGLDRHRWPGGANRTPAACPVGRSRHRGLRTSHQRAMRTGLRDARPWPLWRRPAAARAGRRTRLTGSLAENQVRPDPERPPGTAEPRRLAGRRSRRL